MATSIHALSMQDQIYQNIVFITLYNQLLCLCFVVDSYFREQNGKNGLSWLTLLDLILCTRSTVHTVSQWALQTSNIDCKYQRLHMNSFLVFKNQNVIMAACKKLTGHPFTCCMWLTQIYWCAFDHKISITQPVFRKQVRLLKMFWHTITTMSISVPWNSSIKLLFQGIM